MSATAYIVAEVDASHGENVLMVFAGKDDAERYALWNERKYGTTCSVIPWEVQPAGTFADLAGPDADGAA